MRSVPVDTRSVGCWQACQRDREIHVRFVTVPLTQPGRQESEEPHDAELSK